MLLFLLKRQLLFPLQSSKNGIKLVYSFLIFGIFLLKSDILFAQRGIDGWPASENAPAKTGNVLNSVSPNVATLGVFGDIPISNYTGDPMINIPLFNLKGAGQELPVELSYNLSMVKPDVHPGWVGLGWGLNIAGGGVITRKRNDMADEGNRCVYNDWLEPGGDPHPSGGFYRSAESRAVARGGYAGLSPGGMYLSSLRDSEPDEFSFKFMGFSGKFFLDPDGKWKVRSEQDIKVEFNGEFVQAPFPDSHLKVPTSNGYKNPYCEIPALPNFKGFTLTDNMGIKYIFGGNDNSIEYGISYTDQSRDDWLATSWFLTKIVLPNSKEVNFTYERGKLILDLQISASFSLIRVDVNGVYACGSTPEPAPLGGQVISPVYMTSVRTPANELLKLYSSESNELYYSENSKFLSLTEDYFYPGTGAIRLFSGEVRKRPSQIGWRKLDSISLNVGLEKIKSFRFLYNSSSKERLMLLQVVPVSARGVSDKPYRLQYGSSPFFSNTDGFPEYFSEKSDHWGYFNDKKSDYYSLKGSPKEYYDQRNSTDNPIVFQRNLLTKIGYPTGGASILIYEQGQYRSSLDSARQKLIKYSVNQYGGAPRIKDIVEMDETGTRTRQKSFYYVKGYTTKSDPLALESSGILSGVPKYNYHYLEKYQSKQFNSNISVDFKLKTTNLVLPVVDEFFYNPVGYSEVVELETSIINGRAERGYTIYKYTSFDDEHFDDPATNLYPDFYPYYPVSSRAFERGRLKYKGIYDKNDKLLESKTITWGNRVVNESLPRDEYTPAFRIRAVSRCSGPSGGNVLAFDSWERAEYKLYYYPFRPLKEEVVRYPLTAGAPVVTTTNYKYNDYKLLKEKVVNGSAGEDLITRYRYPFDVINPAIDQSAFGQNWTAARMNSYPISSMVSKHIIATPVEIVDLVKRNGTEQIRSASLINFKGIPVRGSGDVLIVPFAKYSLVNSTPEAPYKNYLIGYDDGEEADLMFDGRMKPDAFFQRYDGSGNLVTWKNGSFPPNVTSSGRSFWGYDQNYLVGQVSGAQVEEAGYTSFEDREDNWGGMIHPDGFTSDKTAPTGEKVYRLEIGLNKTALDPQIQYILTYWIKDGSVAAVTGTSSPKTVKNYNGWTMVRRLITGITELTITGTGFIDEIRISPSDTKMVTYTYNPGGGISSVTDENGQTLYYKYDDFQRLKLIIDHNGNILNSYDYHYKP